MLSPDEMEAKSVQVSIYGVRSETEPILHLSGTSLIGVPLSGGGTSSFFATSNSDIKMTANIDSLIAAFCFRPRDGFSYRFKVGHVRSYDLQYASGSLTNTLSSLGSGFVWGTGIRWNLSQATLVSCAVNLDLGYNRTDIKFDRFESNAVTSSVDEHFSQDEFQGALSVSKRWKMIEPYVGLKVFRVVSKLSDESTKMSVRGQEDSYSPFVGSKVEFFDREYFTVEVSFVDDKSISAGAGFRF